MTPQEGIRNIAVQVQPKLLSDYLRLMRYIAFGTPGTSIEQWAVVMPLGPFKLARPLEAGGRWSRTPPPGRHLMLWSPPPVVWMARRWHRLRRWIRGSRGGDTENKPCH